MLDTPIKNAIAIGDHATCTKDYEFVIRTSEYTLSTIMTKKENKIIQKVIRRMKQSKN